MAREKKPTILAPRIPQAVSHPYRVKDGDDWASVADVWKIGVHDLIQFNFKTSDTDEINWYLRNYVGCNVSKDHGMNWAFSSSADPGKIYIPMNYTATLTPDMLPDKKGGQNELAEFLDGLPEHLESEDLRMMEQAHLGIEMLEFFHVGLAVSGTEALGAAGLGLEIAGPFLGEAAVILAIANAHAGAIEAKKKALANRGVSYGVVLAANGALNRWIKSTSFVEHGPVRDVDYPEEGKHFQDAANWGLLKGLAYGRQLNRQESRKLLKILMVKAGYSIEFMKTWDQRSDAAKINFYRDLAGKFQRDFMARE